MSTLSYKERIKLDPNDTDAYISWCVELLTNDQDEEAEEKFRKAIQINPKELTTYIMWFLALYGLEKFEKAIEILNEGIIANPKHKDIYYLYYYSGETFIALKKYEDAILMFKKSLKKSPTHYESYRGWGQCLYELREYEDSIEKYRKGAKTKVEKDRLLYYWGLSLSKIKKYEDAIKKFQDVIAINPQHSDAYCDWSLSLSLLERYEESLEIIDKAIQINPTRARYYVTKALSLHDLGRDLEALTEAEIAKDLDPSKLDFLRLYQYLLEECLKLHGEKILKYAKYTPLENRLIDKYTLLFKKITKDFIGQASENFVLELLDVGIEESKREGSYSFPNYLGDIILGERKPENREIEKFTNNIKKRTPGLIKEGVTIEEIRNFWNSYDIERRMTFLYFTVAGAMCFSSQPHDSTIKTSTIFPSWEGINSLNIYDGEKDSPLPAELMPRVYPYLVERISEDLESYNEDVQKSSSANAFIREEIKKGHI